MVRNFNSDYFIIADSNVHCSNIDSIISHFGWSEGFFYCSSSEVLIAFIFHNDSVRFNFCKNLSQEFLIDRNIIVFNTINSDTYYFSMNFIIDEDLYGSFFINYAVDYEVQSRICLFNFEFSGFCVINIVIVISIISCIDCVIACSQTIDNPGDFSINNRQCDASCGRIIKLECDVSGNAFRNCHYNSCIVSVGYIVSVNSYGCIYFAYCESSVIFGYSVVVKCISIVFYVHAIFSDSQVINSDFSHTISEFIHIDWAFGEVSA